MIKIVLLAIAIIFILFSLKAIAFIFFLKRNTDKKAKKENLKKEMEIGKEEKEEGESA